ncbi:MAG: DEAD/DEAH box helicase, partial [Verrucomicrobiaceae bacterium]
MPETADISSFLGDSRWKDRFEDDILGAANSLVSKVRDMATEETAPGSVSLTGMVGKDEAEVNFWQSGGGWEFETFCSCDIGSFCHHAAALLIKAGKERDPSRLQGRGVTGAVAAALPTARELMKDPPPDLPRVRIEPRFSLRVTREPVDKATRLLLQSLGQPNVDYWISAEASVTYGTHVSSLRASAPEWVSSITQDGQPVILQHDAAAENAATQQLRDTGLSSLQSNSAWKFLLNLKSRDSASKTPDRWFPDPSRVPTDAFWHQFRGEMVARLESLGWTISVSDNVGHRVHEADPGKWDSSLSPGDGGWFSLSVGFDVGGQRYDLLPILAGLLENDFLEETLDRPNNGFVYAPLPDGDALKLPIGRVRKILQHLAALIDPKFPDRARLHALDAASLAGLDGLGIDTPPALKELAEKLHDFSGIDDVPPAQGLRATLRDYQLAGFHWMQFLARHGLHGILADDMGL